MGCNKPLDKQKMKKHKKGLWSPEEDDKLRSYILSHGFSCWSSIPVNAGLQRNGKSCRLRWINYLRPGLKRGMFNREEEDVVFTLHQLLGNKWSQIAQHLPGRTDNEIKNYWHSYLKKRVAKIESRDESTNEQIQESELSQLSSLESNIPHNSSIESFENMKGSPTDTDQSIQKSSLPKVLFAEWLSLDQFHGQNSDFKNSQDNAISSYDQEALSHSVVGNEGSVGSEMNTNDSEIFSVDDIMLQSAALKFEDHQILESGLIDNFPGEFNINYDDMYMPYM